MALDTYIVGNDGNFSFSIGGTTQGIFKARAYAATLSRPVSELTAFGDTGRRKRLGMLDVSGTINAVFAVDATGSTNTAVDIFGAQNFSTTVATSKAPQVTLTLYDGSNDAKIVADCVFAQFAFNSAKDGDTTCTVNFENASGTAPVAVSYTHLTLPTKA